MLTRRRLIGLAAAVPFAALSRPAFAAPDVFSEAGMALRGADPVAYFLDGGPQSGLADHALMWRGAMWHFASARNRAAFEMNPDAYAPRFGGYCAYALAQGALASTVPEAWTIYEGRLYLNYSIPVRSLWQQDIPGNLALAKPHWPSITRG